MKNLLKVALLPVLASALALSACNKGDKKADDTKGDDTAAKTTDTDPAAKPAEPTPTPTAAGATMTKEQAGDAMVAMMEKLADVAEANKGDCDKTADEFTAIMDKNKALMEASKKLDADPANKEFFKTTYGPKMEAPMKRMMPVLMECKDNKKLEAAFKSFE